MTLIHHNATHSQATSMQERTILLKKSVQFSIGRRAWSQLSEHAATRAPNRQRRSSKLTKNQGLVLKLDAQ